MFMKRIGFLATAILVLFSLSCSEEQVAKEFSTSGHNINLYTSSVSEPVTLFLAADTHMTISDEREEPFRVYSKRMSTPYNNSKHYKTGEMTAQTECFSEFLSAAEKNKADAVIHLGDLMSYPSEYAVEWVCNQVQNTITVPFYYTSGNHDWHYEGMEGHQLDLRDEWETKRLSPLYFGNNPLYYSAVVKGIRLIFIDDSLNEILPEQAEFVKSEVAKGDPAIVFAHIPFYSTGRNCNYGICHPEWKDINLKYEGREPWTPEAHAEAMEEYKQIVTTSPNVLAVFQGHVHSQTLDIINGTPSFSLAPNAYGHFYKVTVRAR